MKLREFSQLTNLLGVSKFMKLCMKFGVRFYGGPCLVMLSKKLAYSKLVDVEKLLVYNMNFISYNL